MSENKEREAFEAWWLDCKLPDDWHTMPMGDRMWLAYQAALAPAIRERDLAALMHPAVAGMSPAGAIGWLAHTLDAAQSASPAALTDAQRRAAAKAMVEVFLGFPAPDREPGDLDLRAVDAVVSALAAQPAAPADLLEAQYSGAQVGEQVGYARGYADGVKADRQGVALSEPGVMGVVDLEVVIDEDGFPVWCAAVPNACQEHIKDAVEREIFGAEKWVVRSYIRHPGYLAPKPAAQPVELGEFRIHPCHDAAFGCQYDVVATSSQHAMLATMDGAKLYIVGDSIHATMQDAWQDGYRAGIEKGRKDQAVHEKHYLAGFNAARASSSRAEVEKKG